jgi:hypothetical protein
MSTETKNSFAVTDVDHMVGGKLLTVSLRSGVETTLYVKAPSRRHTRTLPALIQAEKGFEPVFRACLEVDENGKWPGVGATVPKPTAEQILDRLTMESAAAVETVCLTITFGEDWVKKNLKPLEQLAAEIWESLEAKLFAVEQGIPATTSTAGPTQSSTSSSD